MLTKAEAIAEIREGRVYPDKLRRKTDGHYLPAADQMLAIYREGAGKAREELHAAVQEIFWGAACPVRRIRASCKLLDDVSDFTDAKDNNAARLRLRVFKLAAEKHPLVKAPRSLLGHCEREVKEAIAREIGRPWMEIEADLFGDVYALHRLKTFSGYATAEALLSRYNEAQLQAVLYDATHMRIVARRGYKQIIRAAKLARLMHSAARSGVGFEFIFDGPASALRATKRYGILMARVIPALLACEEWELSASIRRYRGAWQPQLLVTSKDGYRSSNSPLPEFDSAVEQGFAERWGVPAREGWTLRHESEPRFSGQKAFFPDFTFEHQDGRRVLFEIVGHWTPEYLKAKHDTLRTFVGEPIVLAVRAAAAGQFSDLGLPIIPFKSALKIECVLSGLRQQGHT
jgi:predicted nuclease of restriction endonuclease-like RecB superfamily